MLVTGMQEKQAGLVINGRADGDPSSRIKPVAALSPASSGRTAAPPLPSTLARYLASITPAFSSDCV